MQSAHSRCCQQCFSVGSRWFRRITHNKQVISLEELSDSRYLGGQNRQGDCEEKGNDKKE